MSIHVMQKAPAPFCGEMKFMGALSWSYTPWSVSHRAVSYIAKIRCSASAPVRSPRSDAGASRVGPSRQSTTRYGVQHPPVQSCSMSTASMTHGLKPAGPDFLCRARSRLHSASVSATGSTRWSFVKAFAILTASRVPGSSSVPSDVVRAPPGATVALKTAPRRPWPTNSKPSAAPVPRQNSLPRGLHSSPPLPWARRHSSSRTGRQVPPSRQYPCAQFPQSPLRHSPRRVLALSMHCGASPPRPHAFRVSAEHSPADSPRRTNSSPAP
mmetsp:Transcript_94368/g.267037  ORF Transcript_94368/g.267037 Transcript_94368/m.267037 type:complete len:269 (-) Transcript_94368:114-920(-)